MSNSRHNRSGRGRHRSKRRKRYNNNRRSRGRKKSTLDPNLFVSKEVNPQVVAENRYQGKNFGEYNLHHFLATNLHKKGFTNATEIQDKVMSKILEGRDVYAISKTGSGKTGAFLIPMIQKLLKDKSQRLIVVAPTRELAMQIEKEAISFIKGSSMYTTLIIGGASIKRQINSLKRNNQIVIGTPGRLKDLHQRKVLDFSTFNNIVLDEVDRMLDMGFVRDMQLIFKLTNPNKQSLFFSATSDKKAERTVKQMINKYDYIKLSENKPSKSVYQDIVHYDHSNQKLDILTDILHQDEVTKSIVFVETKRYADKVSKVLYKKGHKIKAIHGDKRQNQRKRILKSFRNSNIRVLVATNVVARGIDIDDISHVINLDTPTNYEEYIHRIGRVGRNGSIGNALTFVEKRR